MVSTSTTQQLHVTFVHTIADVVTVALQWLNQIWLILLLIVQLQLLQSSIA